MDRVRWLVHSTLPCPGALPLSSRILLEEYLDIIAFTVIVLLSYPLMFVEFQFGEVIMTFTKAHIAKKIADDCGFMKGEAIEILKKLLGIMKARLVAGEDVIISGFGKWSVKTKHARTGRNFKTGKPMVLDARRVVTWKCSARLKKAMNLSLLLPGKRLFGTDSQKDVD